MGWVRGSHVSPCRRDEELLRYGGFTLVTYVTAVALVAVLLHLGGRRSLHSTCQWIHYSACVGGWCLARVRRCWVSGNAVADSSRLRTPARWVRVLAFGTLARRQSCSIATADLSDKFRRCQK